MTVSHKTFAKSLLLCGAVATCFAAGCSSDDAATKDDPPVTAEEEPAAEEPVAEEPAVEEPAAEPAPDMTAFAKAARITEAKTAAGSAGVRLSKVTADGGYATCGLQDGDVVATIAGSEVPAGRPGVDALNDACATSKAIVIERSGETITLGAQ